MDYLFAIVEKLYETRGNPSNNGRRMASAITVMCCFQKLMPKGVKIDTEHLVALLSMLCLMPDVQSRRCDDWNYVMELIPSSFREVVFNSIYELTNILINTKYLAQPEWLFSLPVMHFLRGVSKPFQETEFCAGWADFVRFLKYHYSSEVG